jgi:hypothetical protein
MKDGEKDFYNIVDPKIAKSIICGEKRIGFKIQASIIPYGLMVESLDAPFYGFRDRKTEEDLCSLVREILTRKLAASLLVGFESGRLKMPPDTSKKVLLVVICETWLGDNGKMMWQTHIEGPHGLMKNDYFLSPFLECLDACQNRVLQI